MVRIFTESGVFCGYVHSNASRIFTYNDDDEEYLASDELCTNYSESECLAGIEIEIEDYTNDYGRDISDLSTCMSFFGTSNENGLQTDFCAPGFDCDEDDTECVEEVGTCN